MRSHAGTEGTDDLVDVRADAHVDPPRPAGFDLLFARAYPAAVGLARRALDRDQLSAVGSAAMSAEVATEALTRAEVHRLKDTDAALRRIMSWAADLTLARLLGHPGRVALPEGAKAEDLLPVDLLDDGIGVEWGRQGLPLAELHGALATMRRRDRRVGLVTLGAGLTPRHTAALLGIDLADVERSLLRVGQRLADGRRVDGGVAGAVDVPAEDVA